MRGIIFLLFSIVCFSQPNCENIADAACKQACEIAHDVAEYQGHRYSQMGFDRVIELCPEFDYAYMEKSVPYLKRGDFITWKKLMDKAVEVNPAANLGYRGWCRYQFLNDYKGALEDLEQLEKINKGNIGYSQNGSYHLKIIIALCYKSLGNANKAIELMEKQLALKDYSPLSYDYVHLGVLYLEKGNNRKAIEIFQKQIDNDELVAETYYYLALAYRNENDINLYRKNLLTADEYYLKGYGMTDSYTHNADKVYLSQIEELLAN